MATAKTTTLTVRNHPKLKTGVSIISVDDNHAITNMIAAMICYYCRRIENEIAMPNTTTKKPRRK